jgi:hypothetical protein
MNILAAILVVASTSLHITVWPNGADNPGKRTYTLRCTPAAGTLPHCIDACTTLMKLQRPFAATPPNTMCTQIYGGPREALVTGTYRGNLVRARFSRKDGCEIARWNRVRSLFPRVASTSLNITVWPDGADNAAKRTYTLSCAPAAGTLPHHVDACTTLMKLQRPFAPTPPNIACTQIYGGPQEALVTGSFHGSPVSARFSRKDGCEIERWNRVRFLFPGAVVSANNR